MEGVIREIRRRWYRLILSRNIPKRLWDYGLTWVYELMQRTVNIRFDNFNKTIFSIVVGDTPNISEYTDFAFWDWVWVVEGGGLSEIILDKFVDVAHSIRNALSYHHLKETGRIITRSTVQPVTLVEREKDSFIEKTLHYHSTVKDIYLVIIILLFTKNHNLLSFL